MGACPGRPDHPDFWLLSQAVLDLDAQADGGQDVTDIVARYADPDTVIYVATQRVARALAARRGAPGSPREAALAGGAWVDGFLAGMMVQHLKTRPDDRET